MSKTIYSFFQSIAKDKMIKYTDILLAFLSFSWLLFTVDFRSDVLGQVLPIIGQVLPLIANDWSQVGIANLYSMIHNNGYRFLYLSARAIGQSRLTRDYLKGLRQGELSLPDGPLLLSPSSLASAFHRYVLPLFKICCFTLVSSFTRTCGLAFLYFILLSCQCIYLICSPFSMT